MNPARRKHLLWRRRQITVKRLFDMELTSEGKLVGTCQTCGHKIVKPTNPGTNWTKQVEWWRKCGGALGPCSHCTKVRRDEMFPLTES